MIFVREARVRAYAVSVCVRFTKRVFMLSMWDTGKRVCFYYHEQAAENMIMNDRAIESMRVYVLKYYESD